MRMVDYLVIGNSAAGINAAEAIRREDRAGSILVLTEEGFGNYSKPLITYYLAGKVPLEKMYYRSPEFYAENNIELSLKTRVTHIDTQKRQAVSSDGQAFSYRRLLIASGGRPIIPQIEVSGLGKLDEEMDKVKGIYTLTTIEDARNIKNYIRENNIEKATVLGGGLIGLKAAEALLELGLKISLIELSDRILAATFDRRASEIMESRIKEKAGRIYTSNTIEKISVKGNSLKRVVLADGTEIDCNLLVAAVGVKPNISFIDTGKIKADRGIKAGLHMETSAPDVFAAGDVVQSPDILSGQDANIAIWPLAVMQGRVAGMNMAGKKEIYGGGFFMNSVEILGIPSISMGLSGVQDGGLGELEVLSKVDFNKKSYRKIVIRDNCIVGIIMVGNIERAGIYAGLIKDKIDIGNIKEYIIREDFGLIQLPAEYKKHLVVGEGIEV